MKSADAAGPGEPDPADAGGTLELELDQLKFDSATLAGYAQQMLTPDGPRSIRVS